MELVESVYEFFGFGWLVCEKYYTVSSGLRVALEALDREFVIGLRIFDVGILCGYHFGAQSLMLYYLLFNAFYFCVVCFFG